MDLWEITLRTVFIYFMVFLTLRFMGKREIGRLSVFDLVISVMIAEIAVIVIEDTKRPLLDGLLPMAVLVAIQICTALLTLKSQTMRSWFDGKPSVVIQGGKLDRKEMRKQRYNLDDLMLQLRENKIGTVADVEFALLETSGKLSVIEKPRSSPSLDEAEQGEQQPGRSKRSQAPDPFPKNFRFESLPVALIMDGKLQKDNLELLGKDRFWLNNQLRQNGVYDVKKVFLCTIDHKGKIYIDDGLK
ncbi:DUF421 domain-containing protein [Paenibacillus nasutitermitis]|uniref:UPF0702 transmembrane protein YrbG n=1 Tax=Paenibacillus nasutitermitis TaxID=1652958 RepID=A0A917DPT2_9BACL|nr:DUF421 domain-containing protein [Paenibacillus nasutitermitis]GGD54825.1 UPF0702 transmembrane protein YrbG [Paenibacillus nasutitermitis]